MCPGPRILTPAHLVLVLFRISSFVGGAPLILGMNYSDNAHPPILKTKTPAHCLFPIFYRITQREYSILGIGGLILGGEQKYTTLCCHEESPQNPCSKGRWFTLNLKPHGTGHPDEGLGSEDQGVRQKLSSKDNSGDPSY